MNSRIKGSLCVLGEPILFMRFYGDGGEMGEETPKSGLSGLTDKEAGLNFIGGVKTLQSMQGIAWPNEVVRNKKSKSKFLWF